MHSVQRAQPALGGIQTKAPGYLEPQSSWGPWRAPFLTVEGKVLAIYQQPVQAAFGSGSFRVGVKPEAGKVCPGPRALILERHSCIRLACSKVYAHLAVSTLRVLDSTTSELVFTIKALSLVCHAQFAIARISRVLESR